MIINLDTVDSTNDYLYAIGKTGNFDNGLTVMANTQTKGKGRLKRSWTSKGEGLYASTIRKEDKPLFPLILAVAINKALKTFDIDTQIKWPNDIILNKKKLCGVLCESSFKGMTRSFTVCGFGINVNNSCFDEDIKQKATSLFIETGKTFDKSEILNAILCEMENTVKLSDSELINEFKKNCITLNRLVTIVDENLLVYATDVTITGALVVEDDKGNTREINYGDVSVRGINGEYI